MLKKLFFTLVLLFSLSRAGLAQNASYFNWCYLGGVSVVTSGLNSTNPVQASYPQCTVTVYLASTLVLATIFSDSLGTPLSNPFTANANGSFFFYTATSTHVDVVISGGTPALSAPFTYPDQIVGGAGGGSGLLLRTNGVTNSSQSLLNLAQGPGISLVNSAGTTTISSTVSGSTIATATGYSGRFVLIYADSGTGPVAEGTGQAPGSFLNGAGSQAGVSATPTATEPPGRSFTSDATASVNLKAGTNQGGGAGLGADWTTFGNYLRLSMRLLLFNTTNVRYWIGITDFATGDISGSGLANDTPNRSYAMFRYSSTTDTTFKACTGTSSVLQTCVDTGTTPQTTSSVLFEIVPTSSNVTFFINGTQVAQISTNNPAQGDRVSIAWTADNKNTATSVGATFNSAFFTLK